MQIKLRGIHPAPTTPPASNSTIITTSHLASSRLNNPRHLPQLQSRVPPHPHARGYPFPPSQSAPVPYATPAQNKRTKTLPRRRLSTTTHAHAWHGQRNPLGAAAHLRPTARLPASPRGRTRSGSGGKIADALPAVSLVIRAFPSPLQECGVRSWNLSGVAVLPRGFAKRGGCGCTT